MVVRKMKEKCKDAARMRREKERAEFVELSKLLPLPSSTTSQLDKASIIRLTSSYLRMRAAFPSGLGENWGHKEVGKGSQRHNNHGLYNQQYSSATGLDGGEYNNRMQQQQLNQVRELGSLLLQTLDGFVFALHRDGKIMYISETASVHLGLPQIDLTGSSVFDYVHPSDHNDIYAILGLGELDRTELEQLTDSSATNNYSTTSHYELGRSFCMRMKCILPKRNAGLVTSGYKAIHCNGYLKVRSKLSAINPHSSSSSEQHAQLEQHQQQLQQEDIHNNHREWESYALVAVGHSLLPTASTEVKLTGNSFMFRANLDLRIYYIETAAVELLGFEQPEMVGQSLYQFVHVDDTLGLDSSHRLLLDKGQVVTKYYRLMRRDGGSVWVQSYATLVNNPRNMPKPQHIVSICFVLAENPHDQSGIYSERQQQQQQQHPVRRQSSDCMLATAVTPNSGAPNTNSSPTSGKFPPKESGSSGYESAGSLGGGHGAPLNVGAPQKRREKCSAQRKLRKIKAAASITTGVRVTCKTSRDNGQTTTIGVNKRIGSSISSNSKVSSICNRCQLSLYQCSCMITNTASPVTHAMQTIGSLRRPSDDTCSIVSSIASTSISSIASSHHSADFFGYTSGGAASASADHHSSSVSYYFQSVSSGQLDPDHHQITATNPAHPVSAGQQPNLDLDLRQMGCMMEMMTPPSSMVYDLGIEPPVQQQQQETIGGQSRIGHELHAQQAFDHANCNISPQSALYFSYPNDWSLHDTNNPDHSGCGETNQSSHYLISHLCPQQAHHHLPAGGRDERSTYYQELSSPPYEVTNNLASMNHHRQQEVLVNDAEGYAVFSGGN